MNFLFSRNGGIMRKNMMTEWIKYPHIPNLITMSKPRVLLGKKLYWTFKEDYHCMSLWVNEHNQNIIASHGLAVAKDDLQTLVKSTPEYEKICSLITQEPELQVFYEACKKGRSITGACEYDRNKLKSGNNRRIYKVRR